MDGGRQPHGFFLLGAGPEKLIQCAFPWWPYGLAFDFGLEDLVLAGVNISMATMGGLCYSDIAALPWSIFRDVCDRLEKKEST